ncbi:MAG: hypothetical protein KDD27_23070 [Saprospiraceae bacterium]|nr:hypothetical protein [Saprospiraceae bacterium]
MKYSNLLLLFFPISLFSQGTGLPLGNATYQVLDRLEIKSGLNPDYHSSLKPITRGDAVRFALRVDTLAGNLSDRDRFDLQYLYNENNEWLGANELPQTLGGRKDGKFKKVKGDTLYYFIPASQIKASQAQEKYQRTQKPILGLFYKTPANWFELNKPFFHLKVNPTIHLMGGKSMNGDQPVFLNQRGVEVRGGFDDRIYFYSNITDSQARFPAYVRGYVNKNLALPGNGFYKSYDSSVFDSSNSYDWLNGQAYIGFNVTSHIGMQFGHGKNFIGNGYRSMLLSDFAHNYLYLKINWRVWRIHYQNLYTELTATSAQANPGDKYIPRKYMTAHYLSFDVAKNFTVGLYEATVFNRDTNSNGYELQYLNPVILYRTVEHLLDSEDNILIGLDLKWDLFKRFRLYGQLMMDEYKFSELSGRKGWWANKYGIQAGLQYIDVLGLDHFDLRAEFNTARPYTYTHSDLLGASYSHYNQALAHPLGANFREFLAIARYQPFNQWTVEGRVIYADFGEDVPGQNWGGNILEDYSTHVMDYDNKIGQGISTQTYLLGLDLSYQLFHNLSFDFHYFYRKKNSQLPERADTDAFIGLGFRWNTTPLRMDF